MMKRFETLVSISICASTTRGGDEATLRWMRVEGLFDLYAGYMEDADQFYDDDNDGVDFDGPDWHDTVDDDMIGYNDEHSAAAHELYDEAGQELYDEVSGYNAELSAAADAYYDESGQVCWAGDD